MSKNQKWLWVGVLLLVFAVIKLGALFWWQTQQPSLKEAQCDVQQGCVLPNGVYVKFSDAIDGKSPFNIEINRVPAEVKDVSVSFSMRDMDMGFNRYQLKHLVGDKWLGQGVRLPFCVENRHDYLADIRVGDDVFQTAFKVK